MTTIVLDDRTGQMSLAEVLRSAGEREIQILDSDGRLLATLTLADELSRRPLLPRKQGSDDEDLQRRDANARAGGKTTAELLEKLRSLSPE